MRQPCLIPLLGGLEVPLYFRIPRTNSSESPLGWPGPACMCVIEATLQESREQ